MSGGAYYLGDGYYGPPQDYSTQGYLYGYEGSGFYAASGYVTSYGGEYFTKYYVSSNHEKYSFEGQYEQPDNSRYFVYHGYDTTYSGQTYSREYALDGVTFGGTETFYRSYVVNDYGAAYRTYEYATKYGGHEYLTKTASYTYAYGDTVSGGGTYKLF